MGMYSDAHICQCFGRLATLKRDSVVTISGGRQKTGQQLVDSVHTLARALLHLGVRNGDVVAISAFNSDCYLEWILAVAYIGGIVAPLNYRWSFEEARKAMVAIRPKMLVTDENCDHWHSALPGHAIPSLKWHVSLSSSSSDIVNNSNILSIKMLLELSVRSSGPMNYSYAPEGAVLICFTSGTTGKPKGVVISHAALIVQSLAKVAIVGYSEDDVYLHTAPLCHIGGLSSAMAMLMVGACHVFIPKFEAKVALEAMEQHRVTSLITVPAMMADLISSIRLKQTWRGGDNVKKILNGGGGLSEALAKDATKFFPRAKILSAYGMTETCSSITFMTLLEPTLDASTSSTSLQMLAKPNSRAAVETRGVCVGKPAPHVEIKIRSFDDSSDVGKILTRGPHVMLGYWDQMASNSKENSWLDTGDIGFIDDNGDLCLVGRTSGRIKSGGENVYPEEVESVLLQHPGVISSVVVGIPDTRLGEMVVTCFRLRENWKWSNKSYKYLVETEGKDQVLSTDILRHYCKQKNLSGFKIPKVFMVWTDPFPLTTTGKIKRDQVRRQVMSQQLQQQSLLTSHL